MAKILIAEDERDIRDLIAFTLRFAGYEVVAVGNGAEAVDAAPIEMPDLILMDVRMPGVDGLEATRVIRATSTVNRATPILALTADVQAEAATACRAAGMDDVLAKPIVPRDLLAKILKWGQPVEAVEQARRMA